MDCTICNHGKMRVTSKTIDGHTVEAFNTLKFAEGLEAVTVIGVDWEMAQQIKAALDALFPLVPGELAVAGA